MHDGPNSLRARGCSPASALRRTRTGPGWTLSAFSHLVGPDRRLIGEDLHKRRAALPYVRLMLRRMAHIPAP